MSTYYEMLKIQPTATITEIEAAIETQYHQWRRLVTHHDPNVVEQANRSLRALEQIRTTLTDPTRRAVYDEAIGVRGQIGGLADPEALLSQATQPPPPPRPAPTAKPAEERLDAWVCPKCQSSNPVGARHCTRCGQQLGQECPKCRQLIPRVATFCSHCGTEIQAFLRQQQAEEAARLAQEREAARQQAEATAQAEARDKARVRNSRIGCIVIILIMCVGMGIIGLLSTLQTSQQDRRRAIQQAQNAAIQVQEEATTAAAEAQIPKWVGNAIEVRAELSYVSDSNFGIDYQLINLTQADYIATFLTSDITVKDDRGNTYPSQSSTQPVRDTINAGNSRNYSLSYEGTLDPYATSLILSVNQISDEHNIIVNIPLTPLNDQLAVDFELGDAWDDGVNIKVVMQNNAPSAFVARFKAADVIVTDELANQYQMDEYYRDDQYAALLAPAEASWQSSKSYDWQFEPGIAPGVTTLQVTITDFMGKQFSKTFPLNMPADGVRYEATLDYVREDSFMIDFRIFNIGAENLMVRFETDGIRVQSADGQSFVSQDTGRRVEIVSPGNYTSYNLDFEGRIASNNQLTLVFPIFSGVQNVQVPIQPEP